MAFFSDASSAINKYQQNIQNQAAAASQQTQQKWYAGEQPTSMEMRKRIYDISQQDKAYGDNAWNAFLNDQTNPASPFYSPYKIGTNGAAEKLASYGFDTSTLNREWFDNNHDWEQYLVYNGTTNTPTNTTNSKKYTAEQKAAYQLWQYGKAIGTTEAVDSEWAAMKEEIAFLANNANLNLSDEAIVNKVRGEMQKKYPTLYKLDQSLTEPGSSLLELNHGTDYSLDAMYGAVWAARNNGGTGDSDADIFCAIGGKGNTWQLDQDKADRLDPRSDKFQPYANGATNMDDACMFFGKYSFDNDWISENSHLVFDGNETQQKLMMSLVEGNNNSNAAEAALNALDVWSKAKKSKWKNAEEAQKDFDTLLAKGKLYLGTGKNEGKVYTEAGPNRTEVDLNILNKMDASIGKGDQNPTGKLVPMTRAIDYKYSNYVAKLGGMFEDTETKPNGEQTAAALNPDYDPTVGRTETSASLVTDEQNQKVARAADAFEDKMTDSERALFSALPGVNGQQLAEGIYNIKQGFFANGQEIKGPVDMQKLTDPEWVAKMATKQAEKADQEYLDTGMKSLQLRTEYEQAKEQADKFNAQVADIEDTYGDVMMASEAMPDIMNVEIGGQGVMFMLDEDGKYTYDPVSEELPEEVFQNTYGMSRDEFIKKLDETAQRLNDRNDSINAAKKRIEDSIELDEIVDLDTGASLEIPYVYDKANRRYTLSPTFDSRSAAVAEYLSKTGEDENQLWKTINNKIDELNEYLEGPDDKEYNAAKAQADYWNSRVSELTDGYNKAVDELNAMNARRSRVNDITLRNSGMYVDPRNSDTVLDYISGYTSFEAPNDSPLGVIGDLQQMYTLTQFTDDQKKGVSDYAAGLRKQAQQIRAVADAYPVTEFYAQKMGDAAGWLEKEARLYDSYLISWEPDFSKLAEEGWKKISLAHEQDDGTGVTKNGWEQMSNLEQDIYCAIYAKNGQEAADQFYTDLEGSLISRAKADIEERSQEIAESGFLGRLFSEIGSIAMPVLEVPANIMYLISGAAGEENKWLRMPSEVAKQANAATIKELHNLYDGTVWGTVLPGLAEMINNRGRSAVTALTFGGLFPEGTSDIVHAFPISTIAFGEAYEEAKENGMNDLQAWSLGLVNFACESVTEGIEFGHYNGLFDKNITLKTFKEYCSEMLKNMNWLSEAVGETANNILERSFNKWIGGDKSDHERRKMEYIQSGLCSSEEEAEILLMADYVKEDIHTAIVSALSSFLDVGGFAARKMASTAHYAYMANRYNKTHESQITINDLFNQDRQRYLFAEETRQKMLENAKKPYMIPNQANVSEGAQAGNQTEYDVDSTILENSVNSDQTAITSTIAAILRASGQDPSRANAAAVAFVARFGDKSIQQIQTLLDGGRKTNTNINKLKLGIQYAMMGNGECGRMVTAEDFLNATPEQQAEMLAKATQNDANNPEVQNQVNTAVHENRVAEAMKEAFGADEAAEIDAFQENADEEARATYIAEQEYQDRVDAQKAARDNVTSVTMDFLADPSDDNLKRQTQAQNELAAADAVAKEYEQALNKQKEKLAKAEWALNKTKEETLARVRAWAEEKVGHIEQQEAEAERQAAEAKEAEAQAAAEEAARLQAEEDVRTGKAQEDSDLAKIDQQINKLGLKGEQADQLREKLTGFYHDMKTGNVDTSRLLSDAEAMLTINDMSRRLGVPIEVDEKGELPEGRDGRYKNGRIVLNKNLTVGQAMMQVALHEITHSLEQTKSYGKYRDTVLDILYSDPEQREKAIQDKIDFYEQRGVSLGETAEEAREGAIHEIVADFAMDDKTFANRETIDRMLDEGLGGKIRNALHNINQYLKNAKLSGPERAKAENLRKAEYQYIKAMNERRNMNTHPSSEQFSVNQFAQAAGLFYNEVEVKDNRGNIIAAPGLYTADPANLLNKDYKGPEIKRVEKVTAEMMEQTPVGLLTNAALSLGTMTRETVDKVHNMFADLMTMCSNLQDTNLVWEIAGSTLYSEFSAIKANSDKQYSSTVDFGTICTKTQAVINQLSRDMLRVGRGLTSQEILEVYNDVFNADLKVPCPVCYVFSRWLGVPSLLENIRQYQNRFLGEEGKEVDLKETQRRVNDFIKQAQSEYGIDKSTEKGLATYEGNLKKERDNALARQEKIKNGKDGIAQIEAKIAGYQDKLRKNPARRDWQNYLASNERKLAALKEDLADAEADYKNAAINVYARAINKKKADIESTIKDKLVQIEGNDKGKRGINDDIRDAIKEGKPYDKLKEKRTKLYGEIDSLNAKLREVDAYNWVTQALCYMDRDGNFVIDPEFKRTRNEILLDLNRTGEFAKDIKNWTYRSTRGAGMGKAILPYSGATIGDSVLGTGSRTMTNPYNDGDSVGAFNALKSAIAKAKRQNLIGGQRFQSTSDFRPEWGLDYIMTFVEQQAIGSNGQLYTKVNEAVPLYASVGIDTNCSIMPYANGWHDPAAGEIEAMSETEKKSRVVTFRGDNGEERTVILDFSDVTGMNYDAARLLSKSYDNVQMIMVGINDIHIRACLAGEEIDFVIPWHASGNTKSQLQNMMATVKEKLTNSSDYTKVQTDSIADKENLKAAHTKIENGETLTEYESSLIHKEQMREARMRLLTGKKLTATDISCIKESQFLTSLYERFMGKTLTGKKLPHDPAYWISENERVSMTTGQAEQIFPYEYWDTSLTKDQADENGWRFVQYCQELGLVPRFSGANQKDEKSGEVTRFGNFSGAVYDDNGNIIRYDRDQMAKGYWKTLIDRKMYDNKGNYRSQQQIDASKVQTGELMQSEEGRVHVKSNIPDSISGANYRGDEAEAKYKQADATFRERVRQKAEQGNEQAVQDLKNIQAWESGHANDHEQYRVSGDINAYADLTAGEMMQLMRDAGVETESNKETQTGEQFSMSDGTEMTPGEMLQLLRDAGVYQQEQSPIDYEPKGPQRQFGSETVQNAQGVSQTIKNWLKTHSDYTPDTNEAQIDRAVDWIMSKRSQVDPDGFWGALEEVESQDFNPLTADGQARMFALMSLASNKGDRGLSVQLRIADAINKQGTTIGRALQSRVLYRLMTPAGRLSIMQKEVDRVNQELRNRGKEGNIKLSNWILQAAAAAQTEEEFQKAREAMWKELGSQMPVSWWDRLQAWRMLSMLGNPRTHIRNMIGNSGFMPAVLAKDKIGAALEYLFVPEGERTKAFRNDRDALAFADEDAEKMQSTLRGEKKYSDATQIKRHAQPFGKSKIGQIFQGASDFSSDMLEKEDWVFLKWHYKNALAGWMTANNVTAGQMENNSELLTKAREYAISEAQKATYRDANVLADFLSKADKIPGLRLISTSVLPFKRTPMNILERGLEYSPLGFLKNITVDAVRLAEYQKWANGKKAEKASWALSPTQFIDKLSSGLTGLGIAGLGAFMKSMGWLSLGFKKDDPEDEFRKANGDQEYSIHLNLFGNDITYTIDWAAPASLPLFVGASMQEAYENAGEFNLGDTLESMLSVTEPIWNLSMLDGVNSLLRTSQYETGNVTTQIGMRMLANYASSFVPTLVGQISKIADPARRKAYVPSGAKPSSILYSLEQMENKTPWSVNNIPYRDHRGNEDRRSRIARFLEALSPGYWNEDANDATLNELERLYKENKDAKNVKSVVPEETDKSFSVKGETIKLTDQQYDQMDVDRKELFYGLLDRLMADPYYSSDDVDDAARINMVDDIRTYATQQAMYNQFPQVDREDWITRAQKNNIDMLDVIKKRSEDQIKQDSIDGWSDALIDSIKTGSLDDVELARETLELHDLDDKDIDKIVKKAFSKDYIKAYKDDKEDDADAIEAMLDDAGFDFDYSSWLENTIKSEENWLGEMEEE